MTETKAPYVATQAPAWTVARPTTDWSALVEHCTLFSFPPSVAAWYAIDDAGLLYANGVDENAFRALWEHLTSLEKSLPRAMGNAMNYAELHFGDDLLDELLVTSGRRESTLRQYKRVYDPLTGVAPERQRPDVKYSYDREVAPLPPEQQVELLDRIEAREFENSDQVHAERLRIQREPPRESFEKTVKLSCPICGADHAWDIERLQWSECGNCHGKPLELRDRLYQVHAAVRAFFSTGEIDALQTYVDTYHVLENQP